MTTSDRQDRLRTPFADLDAFVALPRVSRLLLSPAGDRLVTTVATLDPDRTSYVTALWEIDPGGRRPARRLTRSAKGESPAAFLPDGGLLFTSSRPDPSSKADDDAPAALWLLPAGGGEARVVAVRAGGVQGAVVARDDGRVVLTSATLPGSTGGEDDERRRKARSEAKVAAILHESYPIRFWDHDLGPDQTRLLTGRVPAEPAAGAAESTLGRIALHDLTPVPGRALDEAGFDVSPDGSTVATTWAVPERGGPRSTLVAIDTATGERRVLLDDPEEEYESPVFSPNGLRLAVLVSRRSTPTAPPRPHLAVLDLPLSERTDLALGWDRWPGTPTWTPDGTALVFAADDEGRAPLFRLDLAGDGVPVRLTGDDGAYSDVQVSPDGRWVYALRSAVDAPPVPVRLDARAAGQTPQPLPAPVADVDLPGTLTEVEATADDGTPLRAWLVLPEGASAHAPVPLLLWIHGGPLHSWNSWSWRWNPWLMAARGYAVLLPDPALSTGYGDEMVRRGWGRWGDAPYTDLMTVTDAAVARPDVDEERTAAMGGSFGGYMANWIAGHTDRFAGIVTHASLWALDQFAPTTDAGYYWRREMSPEMTFSHSPHRFVDEIRTPVLVIHGDKDYRVPIGEGLRLWAELAERSGDDGSVPHKFLYFPDENHWVLKPQHAKVWYQVVEAFLDTTVHGKQWQVPDLLR